VPAHNEEELLPGCLAALRCAAAVVDVPVHLLVVLDACTDRTAEVAEPAAVIEVWERSVGAARRADFTRLMHEFGADRVWLATTDADTQVPRSWLADQLVHARRGVDAVAGMVSVTDWRGHAPAVVERFRRLHPSSWGITTCMGLIWGCPLVPTVPPVGSPRCAPTRTSR
jgi:glycosyltransferase involved in cell wall biosynthesis